MSTWIDDVSCIDKPFLWNSYLDNLIDHILCDLLVVNVRIMLAGDEHCMNSQWLNEPVFMLILNSDLNFSIRSHPRHDLLFTAFFESSNQSTG